MDSRRWTQRLYAQAVRHGEFVPERDDPRRQCVQLAVDALHSTGALIAYANDAEVVPNARRAVTSALMTALTSLALYCKLAGFDLEELLEDAVLARESARKPSPPVPAPAAPTIRELVPWLPQTE
jgi:hypothetical protein